MTIDINLFKPENDLRMVMCVTNLGTEVLLKLEINARSLVNPLRSFICGIDQRFMIRKACDL